MPEHPLTLQQSAMRHGAYRWVEHRLFELTGAWSAGPGLPPALRVHLFSASAAHAAHADEWYARLPVLAVVDRSALCRPAGPVLGPLMALLAEGAPLGDSATGASATGASATGDSARFVVCLYRVVLPALLDSYARHAARLSPVADEPSRRAVAAIVRSEEAELAEGGRLVDELLAGGAGGPAATALTASRAVLEGAGAPDGDLVPWSDARCAW